MKKTKNIDFTQIESERRKTLELVLVVLLLGFVLNVGASVLVNYLFMYWQNWLVITLYLLVLLILVTIILRSLLYPGKENINIPVVLFFDTKLNTISIPTQIHFPISTKDREITSLKIPFPVLCRIIFEKNKKYLISNQSETLESSKIMELMESLLEYAFINHYSLENSFSWAPKSTISSGPFNSAYSPNLPSKEFSRGDLATISGNILFSKNSENFSFILPANSKIKHETPHKFLIDSHQYKLSVSINSNGLQHMRGWKYSIGTLDPWYRELSSDYDNTVGVLLEIQIEFTPKVTISRYINEEWLPYFIRPTPSLQQIYLWMNSWVTSAKCYFGWLDEDLKDIQNSEISDLVDETTLIYKPRTKGATPVQFQ